MPQVYQKAKTAICKDNNCICSGIQLTMVAQPCIGIDLDAATRPFLKYSDMFWDIKKFLRYLEIINYFKMFRKDKDI